MPPVLKESSPIAIRYHATCFLAILLHPLRLRIVLPVLPVYVYTMDLAHLFYWLEVFLFSYSGLGCLVFLPLLSVHVGCFWRSNLGLPNLYHALLLR